MSKIWLEDEITDECILGLDEAGRGPLAGPCIVSGVILPKGYSEKEGMAFVESVRGKIKSTQEKIEHKSILITEEKPLQTLTFRVLVKKAARKDIFSSLKSGVLTIEYPDFLKTEDTKTQQYFWNSINYFLKKE